MELCEAHWRGQNAAAQGRTVKGQDRGAVGQHQERAPTRPVILPSTNCRLYYRLVSKHNHRWSPSYEYRFHRHEPVSGQGVPVKTSWCGIVISDDVALL